jgi:hypothetical protein
VRTNNPRVERAIMKNTLFFSETGKRILFLTLLSFIALC